MAKGVDINWEDDDESFGLEKDAEPEAAVAAEFESLLESGAERHRSRVVVGEKTRGVVSSISTTSNDILIDLGGKMSGVIDKLELQDESGEIKIKVGDEIEAFVLSKKGGEVTLSYKMSQTLKSVDDLEAAYNRGLPVRGQVAKLNKGGFEVMVLGKTAFCPISQIDTRFVENGQEYVGQTFEFKIEQFEDRGRNIVLSRSALLRAQAEVRLKEILANLKPDTILDGTVKEVRDFGAFVDIGGVDGMVHVSEISHQRVAKAQDAIRVGEKVKVKVLKVDEPKPGEGGRPKISLSIKAAARDPWEDVEQHVESGKTYTGRVVSLQPFGAFVEIKPGFEGLVHISEMSWGKRIHHPSDVVKLGDAITVSVKDIDRMSKRISLSMKQVEDDPWFDATNKMPVGKTILGKVERLKSFGALVEVAPNITGLVPISVLKRKFGEAYRGACTPGKELEVRILNVDTNEHRVQLTLHGIDEDESSNDDYLEYLKAEKVAAAKAVPEQQHSGGHTGSFGALLSAKLGQKK